MREHRTLNAEHRSDDQSLHWKFDVRCSAFDVSLSFHATRAWYHPRDWSQMQQTESITGTSTSTPTTVASYGAVSVVQSIQLLCLWGTELEDAIESLRNSEGHGCGVERAAIGPACSGTCGDHFPGRRGEPGYKGR